MLSPGRKNARATVEMAAMPLLKAAVSPARSRAAMRFSTIDRLG